MNNANTKNEKTRDLSLCDLKNFEASIGGYFGDSFNVSINFETKKLVWKCINIESSGNEYNIVFDENSDEAIQNEENLLIRVIEQKTLDNFINELEKVEILKWNRKYVEHGICDGTSWSVVLIFDKKKLEIHGSNAYPENWGDFCKAIKKITGKAFH